MRRIITVVLGIRPDGSSGRGVCSRWRGTAAGSTAAVSTAVVSTAAVSTAAAFHGGGGFHGGGFQPARRPGSGAGSAARRRPGGAAVMAATCAPLIGGIGGRWVGNRFWHPGYWGWRGGARLWIGPGWGVGFYPGCAWVQPGWVWNGYQWVWQEGYCGY